MRFIFAFFLIVSLTSCSAVPSEDKTKLPLVLEASSYIDLPRWDHDDHQQVLIAFEKSCKRILKIDALKEFTVAEYSARYQDWHFACNALDEAALGGAQDYFEKYFQPYKATMEGGEDEGLFTGYYESALSGSKIRKPPYIHPIYARPDDLVMVDLGSFRQDLKGRRIAGRVLDGRLRPYEDRKSIDEGKWPHNEKVLIWVDDPVEAFFLHIQGSGRVNMDDGTFLRVGYAGQNGHPYYAIGRELIKREHLEKENVSLQSIRAWLEANPEKAWEIMHTNKSYVFFRVLDEEGPLGGEGVALTAERSLAIDHSKIPYGIPVWLDIDAPIENENKVRRLVIAQDTGGAIRGAVRGDVYWGHGARAEHLAGHMKSKGRYWLLLPKKMTN